MISDLLCAADPVAFARRRLDFSPDPIQARFLASRHPRRLLKCCRQWGKSTAVAALAVHRFVYGPMIATTGGDILALSTPRFRRGFFYYAWTHGGDTWQRYTVTAFPRLFLKKSAAPSPNTSSRRLYCRDFVPVTPSPTTPTWCNLDEQSTLHCRPRYRQTTQPLSPRGPRTAHAQRRTSTPRSWWTPPE